MGRLEQRIAKLEGSARSRAVAEMRSFFTSLSDEELARFVTGEVAILEDAVSEEIALAACGLSRREYESLREEEANQRIEYLVDQLGLSERSDTVWPLVRRIEEQRRRDELQEPETE